MPKPAGVGEGRGAHVIGGIEAGSNPRLVSHMAEFFELDPLTGIRTDTEYNDETGELTLIRTSDVEPVLNWSRKVSNEVGKNTEDMKRGWWLYAKIPPIEIVKMRQLGINVFDQNDGKRMFEYINEHLPWLKCTTGKEGKASSTKFFMPGSAS